MEYLQVDGNLGHGGGQILRSALVLSIALNRPFEITAIRQDRPKPGLRRQHLCGVTACAKLCNAKVEGAELGSKELKFAPSKVKPGKYDIAIGTGGSTTLVLQSMLIPLALQNAKSQISVIGGTYCPFAPTAEFFVDTLVPRLNTIGFNLKPTFVRGGFFTAGSGEIQVSCLPSKGFKCVDWTKKTSLGKCTIEIVSSQFPERTLQRIAKFLTKQIEMSRNPISYEMKTQYKHDIEDEGAAVIVRIEGQKFTTIFSEIARYGLTSEALANSLGKQLRNYLASGAPIESHLADQIILPMLLAEGGRFLTTKPSDHLNSCCRVVEIFTGQKIGLEKDGKNWIITVPKVNKNAN